MEISPSSYGDLLRLFRKRRKLTQQSLADLIGVHRNTISIWERGDFLPESKTIVLETAQKLNLEEMETRQLLEASLTSLAPHWLVPFRRNPSFSGRESILQALHARLAIEQPVALTQASALSGLGGIGKTQVAIEYAYRYAMEYSAIFWLAAETAESLMTSLQLIADHLQLPELQATEQSQIIAAIRRWLSTHSGWLLIADNVEDLDLLQAVLPATSQSALLLTTRRQALGTLAEPLELPPMNSEEGVTLLLRRARRLKLPAPENALQQDQTRPASITAEAEELVHLLDGLPLALDQAGAYIEETGCSIENYVQRFHTQRKQVLAHRGLHGGAHPASVATTLRLSIEQIKQTHVAAADLLNVCAFLHPEAIPEELFIRGASFLGPVLSPVVSDPYQFDLALAALRSASLLIRHPQAQTLSLHRLVQAVLQDQMEQEEAKLWIERVICIVNGAFSEGEFGTWEQCERYLAHALACIPLIELQGITIPEAGELLHKAGYYLLMRGRYREAEPLLKQTVEMGERQFGPNHPILIPRLIKLGELFWCLRIYEPIEPLWQRALKLGEQHLEPDHPLVIELISNLGIYYSSQGMPERAESLYQQALRLQEHLPDPERHPAATVIHNLATHYRETGKYELAESLFQRALLIHQRQMGAEHPEIAFSLNGLATLYRITGKYELAESLYKQALRIREQQLGGEHPETAFSLNDLAALYRLQRKFDLAVPLYQRVLRLREHLSGYEDIWTAQTLFNLATLYQELGDFEQAETFYRRALTIRERILGPQDARTTEILHKLGALLDAQGKSQEASFLYQRELASREETPDPEQSQTSETHERLLMLRQKLSLVQEDTRDTSANGWSQKNGER